MINLSSIDPKSQRKKNRGFGGHFNNNSDSVLRTFYTWDENGTVKPLYSIYESGLIEAYDKETAELIETVLGGEV